jgi:thiosulfate/3-mercaptopyruvate sulfurtransferase
MIERLSSYYSFNTTRRLNMNCSVANKSFFSLTVFLSVILLAAHLDARILSAANGNALSAIPVTITGHTSLGDEPWSAAELIQPEELARRLADKNKPVVIQTGFVHLYKLGHIPGAIYAGPASSPEGLAMFKKAAQDLPRDREIVFYCGCCPMKDCPNIRPAYMALRDLGFKKIRLLNLATNFTQEWVTKGYPVEKGGA